MKKLLLLSAVLLGTAVASQAGIHVDVGFRLPFPPIPLPGRVIISQPAPVYVVPEYCEPPRVVYAPPRTIYVPAPRYYSYPSYRRGYSDWDRRGHSGHDNRRSGGDNRGGHRR